MSKYLCCVPGCAESGDSHPVLHVFPNPEKEPDRFRSWVLGIGGDILGLDNSWIYKNRRVCHCHFEEQYCYYSNKISRTAIPRKKMPGLSTVPRFTFTGNRCMRDIQNIETNSPSTSKGSCGLFGMEFDSEIQETRQHSAQITCDNKENTVPVLDANTAINVSNVYLLKSPTVKRHSITTAAPSVKRKTRSCFVSKEEQALFEKLNSLKLKLNRCQNRAKKYAKSAKMAENIMTNQSFLKILENLSNAARTLIFLQFREQKKKTKGRRFSSKEKIVALSIYKQSPKSYRLLRKILLLPATQTLDKLIRNITIEPIHDERVFKQLKQKSAKMKTLDKLCVLLFDEISLQAYINFNKNKDKINGIVEDGKSIKFANHALVFMIRGLIKNYKQPIAYMFCSGSTNADKLKEYIVETVRKVAEAGFRVIATICDQGSSNQKAIKNLINENRIEKLRNGEELRQNTFEVNGAEIIPLFDPPHLLKGIRNNLLQKNLLYTNELGKQCEAKWEHLEKLYAENPAYKGLRLIPKLTEQHVVREKIGKMRVKFASQVFSQTVAINMGYLAEKGILPSVCQETADILIFFDKLFDSMNGSYGKRHKYGKPYLGPLTHTSVHNELWQKSKIIIKSMKFGDKNGKAKTVPSLENFVFTIESLQYLSKKLIDLNISSIWTRHLNQDPLENFFGSIRSHGYQNTNPSPAAFQSAYTALLVNNLFSAHVAGSNCEEDFCESLEAMVITPNLKTNQIIQESMVISHQVWTI